MAHGYCTGPSLLEALHSCLNISSPPARVHRRVRHAHGPDLAGSAADGGRYVCSFRSTNTRKPSSKRVSTANGPSAAKSSKPILATENHGRSRVARVDGRVEARDVEREREPVPALSAQTRLTQSWPRSHSLCRLQPRRAREVRARRSCAPSRELGPVPAGPPSIASVRRADADASAPARSIRTAPSPSLTPRRLRCLRRERRPAVVDRTQGDAVGASPESPPPPAPRTGARRSVSTGDSKQGVRQRERLSTRRERQPQRPRGYRVCSARAWPNVVGAGCRRLQPRLSRRRVSEPYGFGPRGSGS